MLEPIEDQYQLIGHIARSHGVDGVVLILSEINAPQLFDDIDLVHIQNARGDLIPARIESARVQQKHNRLSFFVKFEHVTDRNQAEALKSFPVYVSREKIAPLPAEDTAADFISFEVTDENDNRIGEVSGIIENPAHLILEVSTGDQQQLLIPFVDEYVFSTDEQQQIIRCRNLAQLADL